MRYMTGESIRDLLKKFPVQFVIADVGYKLHWISLDRSFDFWKHELKSHLANGFEYLQLDQFPDNYAYIASEWLGDFKSPIILLEKHH